MIDINELKFDDKGLIPAIVQDYRTKEVLTLAYMNRESLEISLKEKKTCFFSRSRQKLWRKGETSGNFQHIVSITADCDCDALTVLVKKDGPACHTGKESCFFNPLFENEESTPAFTTEALMEMLKERKAQMPEGSYTTYLFSKGLDKILKKIGEEATEVIIAGKDQNHGETVYEISDLMYHVMVLMVEMGIEPSEIYAENAKRNVIDRKIKQEKASV